MLLPEVGSNLMKFQMEKIALQKKSAVGQFVLDIQCLAKFDSLARSNVFVLENCP